MIGVDHNHEPFLATARGKPAGPRTGSAWRQYHRAHWHHVFENKENAMQLVRRQFLSAAGAAVAATIVPLIAAAQTYPVRPVRVIVPYPPAGPLDVAARLIASRLSERLGKQFYVENIPGASANIGMGRAAKAAPDGYTVIFVANSYVVNPALFDTIPYDPRTDFDAVTIAATNPMVLTIHPSLPARTVKDLIALIKANPGKYNYASPGVGTPGHLVGEQLRLSLGLDIVHVPYNGAAPAIGSAVAGHTPICIGGPAPAVPQVDDGKLIALSVMSTTRLQALPDVPTIAEAGFPGMEAENWFGVLVPAGSPGDIVTLLYREIVDVITLPDIRERFAAVGLEPVGSTPKEFAQRIAVELDKWGKVIRLANIRGQ
jgi:tripartite-type tricarboxylate transporter receptor subunit TctC